MRISIGDRVVALLAAVPCAGFGTITAGSQLSVLLFGAAVVLVLIATTGEAAIGDRSIVSVATAALLAYGGIQLVRFAASQYRASARLTDPGNDFVIEGVLAAAGVALIGTAVFLVTRRARARS